MMDRVPSVLLTCFVWACLTAPVLAADSARGQYLVEALAACDNCHTPRAPNGYEFGARFSGGSQTFSGKDYVVRGPNISSDREAGIGGWSDDALRAAIVAGVGREGPLAPAMPSDSYRALTRSDLDAIVAFLRASAPVHTQVPALPQRRGGWSPHPVPGADAAFEEAALSDRLKRGIYVASIARCFACHSGETDDAPDHDHKFGAGGKVFRTPTGVATASNITSNVAKGLGGWSDEEIGRAIRQGVSRQGEPLKPPMSTLAKGHFAKMSDEDLNALIAYLRTIPAKD
jgi:mono/diheme cytochrome c family protein